VQLVMLTVDGRHLHPGPAEDRRLRRASGPPRPGAVFERLELGHGRIALRTLDGRFLATRPDTDLGFGVYPEAELTSAAAFEEILWPDGHVSLRSSLLTYVSAPAERPVTANLVEPDDDARFRLIVVPAAAVPTQRSSSQSSTPRAASASPSSSACRNERMMSGTA
jgi:hypothetical protein